jgi:hypothetical protein
VAILQTASTASAEDREDDNESEDESEDDKEDEEDKDCMSMSMQVAVKVEAVPQMLRPLSLLLPFGSYNVLDIFECGDSGVNTTLGTESQD